MCTKVLYEEEFRQDLFHVEKDGEADFLFFERLFNNIRYTMHLIYFRVLLSEEKLMAWD